MKRIKKRDTEEVERRQFRSNFPLGLNFAALTSGWRELRAECASDAECCLHMLAFRNSWHVIEYWKFVTGKHIRRSAPSATAAPRPMPVLNGPCVTRAIVRCTNCSSVRPLPLVRMSNERPTRSSAVVELWHFSRAALCFAARKLRLNFHYIRPHIKRMECFLPIRKPNVVS